MCGVWCGAWCAVRGVVRGILSGGDAWRGVLCCGVVELRGLAWRFGVGFGIGMGGWAGMTM